MIDSVPLSCVPHNGFIRSIKVASKMMKIFIVFKESNEINITFQYVHIFSLLYWIHEAEAHVSAELLRAYSYFNTSHD